MELPRVWNLFGEEHLPYRLLLLARAIDRETQRILMERFGLSLAEWRVLAIVCSVGPCSASEVGTAGAIDRAEISRAVRSLGEAGLLKSEPDENHGRRKILSPTRKGSKLFIEVRDERRTFFHEMMDGISSPERLKFDEALEQMYRNLAR